MENIYKIKIRSNPDPRGLYPSERRYSASTVLGLGVVHLALAATALLLASLSLTSSRNQLNPLIDIQNNPTILNNNSNRQDLSIANSDESGKDVGLELGTSKQGLLSGLSEEVNPSSSYNNGDSEGGLLINPTIPGVNLEGLNPTSAYYKKKRSSNQDFEGLNRSNDQENVSFRKKDQNFEGLNRSNDQENVSFRKKDQNFEGLNGSNDQENVSFRKKDQHSGGLNHSEKGVSFRDKLDYEDADSQDFYRNFNPYTNLSLAPCVMSLGALAAGLSGLLAWKRWYIDHNIRWFFFMSIISTLTALSCVIITTIAIINLHEHSQVNYYNQKIPDNQSDNSLKILNEHYLKILEDHKLKSGLVISKEQELPQEQYFDFNQKKPNIRFILALNILISCVLEVMWSILSAKIGFRGMRNTYPDDIVISRNRGKIEVNTVHKGNKKGRIAPPDILNHFPDAGKLAKYFPKIESGGNLPKAESNSEYQERVRQFLSSNNTDDSSSENK